MVEIRLPSGAKIQPFFKPVHVLEIGKPGQPTEVIVHNGKLFVYNAQGQTLISGGVIQTQGVVVGLKSWIHNIIFSATDQDTAAWASGTIYFGDGSSKAINAGNTGNITEKTYVYYDGTSTLKKTTGASFLGNTYILLATIEKAATGSEKAIVTVAQLPSGTINADQIVAGYLNFDRAKGGTLQLGGAADGYGVFSLKDASDVEKIKMDKDGILINSGKITIKDDSETNIIDSKGLISSANFVFGEVNNQVTRNITGTGYSDIPNTSITTASFSRTATVLIQAVVGMQVDTGSALYAPDMVINVDAGDISSTQSILLFDSHHTNFSTFLDQSDEISVPFLLIKELGAGSHTIKIRARLGDGTDRLRVFRTTLFYLVLGK